MTEKLGDVVARIGSVRQLSSVIAAMRGIAAARAREARERVDGVRAYAATVGSAIGQALALAEDVGVPRRPRDGRDDHLVIALCAEQGFAARSTGGCSTQLSAFWGQTDRTGGNCCCSAGEA